MKNNLDPYKIDKLSKVPYGVKLNFVKWWTGGAAFFMIGFGLNINGYDLIFLLGLFLGLFNEYISNRLIKWMSEEDQFKRYVMISQINFKSLFLNVLYGLGLSISVFLIYVGLNAVLGLITNNGFTIPYEPVLFGLLILLTDHFYLLIKKGVTK